MANSFHLIKIIGTLATPLAFSRLATTISALWFIVLWPTLIWTRPAFFDDYFFNNPERKYTMPCDFPQYYMGALAFTHGKLESLYPEANKEAYGKNSNFEPFVKNQFFSENRLDNPIYLHDPVMLPKMSHIDEDLLRLCPELDQDYRYIYPPPLSILLSPLACWDIKTAALKVWPTFGAFALFGTAFLSSRIFRFLSKNISYLEGLIMLSLVFFSFRGRTDLMFGGNITPILSCLIAFVAYAWLRGWQIAISAALIPLLLFKAIGLTWIPILFIHKIQWKIIGGLAFLTVVLNTTMIWLGGIDLYESFFVDILPYLNVPAGVGISRQVLDWFGIYPTGFYLFANVTLLILLYAAYYFFGKCVTGDDRHPRALALLAGTMAVFCMLNFSVWLAYFPNYLCFPFLGWLLWEGTQATGRWRKFIFIGAFLAVSVCASEWIIKGVLFRVGGGELVNIYHHFIFVPSFALLMPLFFLIVSIRRLMSKNPGIHNDRIGANAVVTKDVPAGATVVGANRILNSKF